MNNPKPRPQGWDVKTSYRGPAKPSNKRVDLDPQAFDLLIKQKGVRVKVFLTTFCDNVKSIDGAEHNIGCDYCNGSGFLDTDPICTLAIIQNQGLEVLPEVEGMVDGNSVVATFPTGIELQYFTLVELEDFTEPFMQRVKRQRGSTDVLKYKALRINLCISKGKKFYQGIDFNLDCNTGSINWLPNSGPDPDSIYSVRYDAAVQFRAVRGMHNNRFTQFFTSQNGGGAVFTKMPEEWMLSKEFLVKRKNADGTELLPNLITNPTDPDDPTDPIER